MIHEIAKLILGFMTAIFVGYGMAQVFFMLRRKEK